MKTAVVRCLARCLEPMLGRRPAILLTTAVADLTAFRLPTLEDYPGALLSEAGSGRSAVRRCSREVRRSLPWSTTLEHYPGALPWTTLQWSTWWLQHCKPAEAPTLEHSLRGLPEGVSCRLGAAEPAKTYAAVERLARDRRGSLRRVKDRYPHLLPYKHLHPYGFTYFQIPHPQR